MRLVHILSAVFLLTITACATTKQAAQVRGQLATDTAAQLDESAGEVEQLVVFVIRQEVDKAFADLARQYAAQLEAAGDDRDQIAAVAAAYVEGQAATRQSAEQEAERLLKLAAKIRAGARAAEAINAMADNELSSRRQAFDEFVQSGIPDVILRIIEEAEARHDAIANSDGSGLNTD